MIYDDGYVKLTHFVVSQFPIYLIVSVLISFIIGAMSALSLISFAIMLVFHYAVIMRDYNNE